MTDRHAASDESMDDDNPYHNALYEDTNSIPTNGTEGFHSCESNHHFNLFWLAHRELILVKRRNVKKKIPKTQQTNIHSESNIIVIFRTLYALEIIINLDQSSNSPAFDKQAYETRS